MADLLMPHIPSMFNLTPGQRARVVRGQSIGAIIPDILVGIWSGDLPAYRSLNAVSRHILAWLSGEKNACNPRSFPEQLLISSHAADAALSKLEHAGAIARQDSGEVALRPSFDVLHSVRIVAIEMKLRRWREALDQAAEYREFADESHVVLDGNQMNVSDEVRTWFEAAGIGLWLQRGAGLTLEIEPRPATPAASADRVLAVGKLSSGPYCLA